MIVANGKQLRFSKTPYTQQNV